MPVEESAKALDDRGGVRRHPQNTDAACFPRPTWRVGDQDGRPARHHGDRGQRVGTSDVGVCAADERHALVKVEPPRMERDEIGRRAGRVRPRRREFEEAK